MASKEYIERLQMVIRHLHKCEPTHLESIHVEDEWNSAIVFSAEVELFALSGHPKAKRCYSWSYGEPEEFITILELPPVKSALDAVQIGIAHQVNQAKKGKV